MRKIVESVLADQKPQLPRGWRSQIRERFYETLNKAKVLPQSEWPEKRRGKRFDKPNDLDDQVKRLRSHRDKVAEGLGIDGTLIASKAVMERLILCPDETDSLLLNWQRSLMDEVLTS